MPVERFDLHGVIGWVQFDPDRDLQSIVQAPNQSTMVTLNNGQTYVIKGRALFRERRNK